MTTTVKELIEKLKQEDPDAIVVTTGEHNQPSPFDRIGRGFYAAENTWSGEWGSEDDEDESYAKENGVKAVYIEPVN